MKGANPIKQAGEKAKSWWAEQRGFSNLIVIPAIWAIVSMLVTGLLYGGWEMSRYVYEFLPSSMPEPFRDDRVGILVARFENDPDNEYTLRVRTALERQLPLAADGSAAVEVDLFPKTLELSTEGRLSDALSKANEEGRSWLEKQNAELLIWGRAIPSQKELELRILTRQETDGAGFGRPEFYPLRIPTQFSDQIGTALAGLVAGAGYSAWSQRGEYLSPERRQTLQAWLTRMQNMQDDLPDTLDDKNRKQIDDKIDTAYAQIAAALLADGDYEVATPVVQQVFAPGEDGETAEILTTHPMLVAEMMADIVAQFAMESGQINTEELQPLLGMTQQVSAVFDDLHAEGELTEDEYCYLAGLMAKLGGHLTARMGDGAKAKAYFRKAEENFQKLLDNTSESQDPLSRARVTSYLASVELGLAAYSSGKEAEQRLDRAIALFGQALSDINAESAPREVVRIRRLLAGAYGQRWELRYDTGALLASIETLEAAEPILRENQRFHEADRIRLELGPMLGIHGFVASGAQSGERALELVAPVGQEVAAEDATAEDTAARTDHLQPHIDLAACLGRLAIGHGADAGKQREAAVDQYRQSAKKCQSAATLFERQGNRHGWFNSKLLASGALRLAGLASGTEEMLSQSLGIAKDVARKTEDITSFVFVNQVELVKGASLRALGLAEGDETLVAEAVALHRAAYERLPEGVAATTRLSAEFELGRSLAAFAALKNTADADLEEGIKLLKETKDRFAEGGAALMAREASEALTAAEQHLAKLSTN